MNGIFKSIGKGSKNPEIMNNSWFSKVAVWMVIAMVLFTVFKQFDGRSAANVTNVGYSEFLTEADDS